MLRVCCMRAVSPHPQAPQQLISSQQPSAAGLTPQQPLDSFCEFPAINTSHRSQAYRYAYCLSAVRPTNIGNALSKMDLQQGSAQTWHEPGGAVGEAVQQKKMSRNSFTGNCSLSSHCSVRMR
jgi:carotenoid cleavage dioxygenase-like enzyme